MGRRIDPALEGLNPVEDYLRQLDLDKVTDAILATRDGRKMAEYDLQDVKRTVWETAERWLVQDLVDLQLTGVEAEYETFLHLPTAGSTRIKAVLDLRGVLRGRLNATSKYAGKRVIVDWKTTNNQELGTEWRNRYIDSHQWPIYALLEPTDVFIYRGISRGGKFTEIVLDVPADLSATVNHLDGVAVQRKALFNFPIWPQNRPHACGAFGRECPFLPDCPGEPGLVSKDKSISYSGSNKFLLCPERYRREVLAEGESDSSEESDYGLAVHRGLAELWTQAFAKFAGKEETK